MSGGMLAVLLVLACPLAADGLGHHVRFWSRGFYFVPDSDDGTYDQISFDVAYNNFWQEIYTFPERRPRTFNVIVSTTKTWLADLLVQLGEVASKRKPAIDWRRSAAFAILGFFYVGLLQWFFYVSVFTELCPHAIRFGNEPLSDKLQDPAGQIDLVKQIFLDNFLLNPFIYFPVFYIIKEATTKTDPCPVVDGSEIPGVAKAKLALERYGGNFVNDNLVSSSVWILGDMVVMTVPIFMRMPLEHTVGFFWTMLLSSMRGGCTDEVAEALRRKSKTAGASPPSQEEGSMLMGS